MKPIVQKVLESGIIDKSAAKLMEHWGYLEPGAADQVKEENLLKATKETLTELVEELSAEIDKDERVRETPLDLEHIRWPAAITIYSASAKSSLTEYLGQAEVMVDRMGRYYIRPEDVKPEWLVPGYHIGRTDIKGNAFRGVEVILSAEPMYKGELQICWLVTTEKMVLP